MKKINGEEIDDDEEVSSPTTEVQVVNPATGKYSAAWNGMGNRSPAYLKPKQEQAVVLYTLGKLTTLEEAAAWAGIKKDRFSVILNSPAGQATVARVRGELDFKYQALYSKFIDVVSQALDHPNPQVALAGASLFAKTQIGEKHKYEISAEDVVKQIMAGTYAQE